jgi:hypothetical protein
VTPNTKRSLDLAAISSGRSLSQEAEARIENSFRDESLLAAAERLAYGGSVNAQIVRLLGETISAANMVACQRKARGWLDDQSAFDELALVVDMLLRRLRPPAESPPLGPLSKAFVQLPLVRAAGPPDLSAGDGVDYVNRLATELRAQFLVQTEGS